MNALRVTFRRTVGMARNYYATALTVGLFLAATGLLFMRNLEELHDLAAGELWCLSVAPFLPVLASLLAMDVWSDEKLTGRMDMLLSAPVSDMDFVWGKVLGVWFQVVLSTVVSWFCIWGALAYFHQTFMMPSLGLLALVFQSALWSTIGVMMSARFRHATAAAAASLTLTVALPRGLWFATLAWAHSERIHNSLMPLDDHILAWSTGTISSAVVLTYSIFIALALFITLRLVNNYRLVGRGGRFERFKGRVSILLAVIVAILGVWLVQRLDKSVDLPIGRDEAVSDRTRVILSEAEGTYDFSLLMSRKDSHYRAEVKLLEALRHEALVHSSARIVLRFVEPDWDIGEAERLVRLGLDAPGLLVEHGRRSVKLSLAESLDERACASAILQLNSAPRRKLVCWTTGHGEASFSNYGPWGLSDFARELSRDGYRNRTIDFSSANSIPTDCAFIVIAAAKSDFSRGEITHLESYLQQGGRLLVLVDNESNCGVTQMLPRWGVKISATPTLAKPRTITGSDVIISDFSKHAIVTPLKDEQLVMDRPKTLSPSAAADMGGVDGLRYTPLASAEGHAFAVVIERGAGVGEDLAVRPTRIVVIGDGLMVMNGELKSRCNANRDFMLNVASYLAGTDALTSSDSSKNVTGAQMDRRARFGLAWVLVVLTPGLVFLALAGNAFRRRHRK